MNRLKGFKMVVRKNPKTNKIEYVITREDVIRYVQKFRESEEMKEYLAKIEKMREDYIQSILKSAERGRR